MPEKPETMADALKDKLNAFKNMDPNQKLVILSVFALVISTLVVLTFWMNRVNYRVLYNNLSMEDAGKIATTLKDKKVNYKLQDGGRTILVPAADLFQLRLDLAGSGLPKSGNIGFELFDKADFQSSDFTENIKYVRALQGELSNTIKHLESVEDCRVNLSIPRQRIFLDEEAVPTASVVLKMKQNQSLSDEEVRGIAMLVAGTVEGLKVEKVSIMSTDGRLLSDFLQEGNLGLATYQIRIRNDLQKNVEKKIVGVLESVLGQGKAVVKVNVDIKTEQKAIQKEMFQPVEGNVGIVRSSRVQLEDYNNKNQPAPGETPVQGSTRERLAGNKTDDSLYKQKSTTTNYEISKITESQTVTPGQVSRMTVGVIIDSSANMSAKQLSDLKDVIASVAGIDQARGDVLTLKSIKFDIPKAAEEKAQANELTELLKKYSGLIASAFAPLIILMIMMGSLKKARKNAASLQMAGAGGGRVDLKIGDERTARFEGPDLEGLAQEPAMPKISASAPTALQSDPVLQELQQTLKGLVQENPKMVADVFHKWASSEG